MLCLFLAGLFVFFFFFFLTSGNPSRLHGFWSPWGLRMIARPGSPVASVPLLVPWSVTSGREGDSYRPWIKQFQSVEHSRNSGRPLPILGLAWHVYTRNWWLFKRNSLLLQCSLLASSNNHPFLCILGWALCCMNTKGNNAGEAVTSGTCYAQVSRFA